MRIPLTFLEGPWRLGMGLKALDLGDWLWLDERYPLEIEEREGHFRARLDEVHAMLPEAAPAAAEVLELVLAWLGRHRPERAPASVPDDPLPLRAAGRLVQEDLCVMQPRGGEGYALTAAVLCAPAHWRLYEKLGRPLSAIHAPVPGFGARLGPPVERFFAGLAVKRPVWRANWSVVERPDLFQPGGRPRVPDLSAENAGHKLWLRVERQMLRRLPRTGAVLFTIRTLVRPLAEIAAEPAVASALAARLREMDPAMAAYKGLPALALALLGWLDRQAGDAAPVFAQDLAAGARQ